MHGLVAVLSRGGSTGLGFNFAGKINTNILQMLMVFFPAGYDDFDIEISRVHGNTYYSRFC